MHNIDTSFQLRNDQKYVHCTVHYSSDFILTPSLLEAENVDFGKICSLYYLSDPLVKCISLYVGEENKIF